MDPVQRSLLFYISTRTNNIFSNPPKYMEDKKSIWVKILNFVIEVLKLVIAIFLGLQASSVL